MESISRHQLRAARMLLNISQAQLAVRAVVGVATVRRFELGQNIRHAQMQSIVRALQAAGVIIFEAGTFIGGVEVEIGVALARSAAATDETGRKERQPLD